MQASGRTSSAYLCSKGLQCIACGVPQVTSAMWCRIACIRQHKVQCLQCSIARLHVAHRAVPPAQFAKQQGAQASWGEDKHTARTGIWGASTLRAKLMQDAGLDCGRPDWAAFWNGDW